MRVYIIGMPGTGKTHFGKMLSKSLRLQFFDIDEWIERKEGMLLRHIISERGEKYFRQVEHQVLKELSLRDNSIISCGGGTAVFFDNIDIMKNSGIVVWLNTDLNIIARRISNNISRRPLFTGLNEDEIRMKLKEIFDIRRKFYAKADIVSDVSSSQVSSLGVVIQKIMKQTQRRIK